MPVWLQWTLGFITGWIVSAFVTACFLSMLIKRNNTKSDTAENDE